MGIFEYDEELHAQVLKEEGREEGREEGKKEGRVEGIIETGLELGLPESRILEILQKKLQITPDEAEECFSQFKIHETSKRGA